MGDSTAFWDEDVRAGVTYQIVLRVLVILPVLPTGATIAFKQYLLSLTSLSMYRLNGVADQHGVQSVLM